MTNDDLERRTVTREPGPQPDPMVNEGRASSRRKWAVTAVIAAVLLAVMYGVTTHRSGEQDTQRQSEMQNAAPNTTQSSQGLPGGRTTANAPSTAAPKTSTQGPSR
jgi:negative regulator of sigma E activity